ncbi:MAG TPA: DUF3054 domain-containing protein [Ktedonosporobacter sp.]|jgi:uncharacterized protein YacL|nr:DUF3054 domain-containing protein [Ktedonosporobacter sp.]
MDVREQLPDSVTTTNEQGAEPRKGMSSLGRIAMLVVGDAIIFLIFSAIGRRSHNEAAGFDALWQIALTAAPFALGWFLVSPFVGAFRRGLEMQPRKMITRTTLAWTAAWPVGLLIRGLTEQRVPPLSFALITLITNMVLLVLWRGLLSFGLGKLKRS